MKPFHYEIDSGLVKELIKKRQNFFLGGRGVGIRFYPRSRGGYDQYWELEIERARTSIYADELRLNGEFLEALDGADNPIAKIDLKHYLKITVVW